MSAHDLLLSLLHAAIAGADARGATERAVRRLGPNGAGADGRATWVIALGKAAPAMAEGAVAALAAAGVAPAGGVIVGADGDGGSAPHAALRTIVGDHPVPGAQSLAAGDAIGDVVRRVGADDRVLVLLSGGASALAAAPVDGVEAADLAQLARLLLGSGLDIVATNAVRKRFARWGAGRLAAALSSPAAPARVHCLVVSDVVGDALAAIGSGPCVADPTTADALVERLRTKTLAGGDGTMWDALPASMRTFLERTVRGELPETPKPGDAAFQRVSVRVVLNNADALAAAAARAHECDVAPVEVHHAMTGEARVCGERVVEQLAALRERCRAVDSDTRDGTTRRACLIVGGETTVTLRVPHGGDESVLGGRSQELALAAARALSALGDAAVGIALLAAGTDGRDGPTDAAGAIVDGATWERIRAAGRDPARDLARHDAYHALDAAGALLRTGPTGTNVMDVVIGVVEY